MLHTARTFLRRDAAGVTVEFVAIFPAFLLVTFFIFEIIVAILTIGTVEKAAQLGARLAIVSDTVATGVPAINTRVNSNVRFGTPCSTASTCNNFGTLVCDGNSSTGCVATTATYPCGNTAQTPLNYIVCRMRSISSSIQASNVTIIYKYVGLGYAGGPIAPSVTVLIGSKTGTPWSSTTSTATAIPFAALVTTILARATGSHALTNLPTVSVTMTGEDLSSAGAS